MLYHPPRSLHRPPSQPPGKAGAMTLEAAAVHDCHQQKEG